MDTLAREQRVRYMGPNYLEHWEYLVNVMISARAKNLMHANIFSCLKTSV